VWQEFTAGAAPGHSQSVVVTRAVCTDHSARNVSRERAGSERTSITAEGRMRGRVKPSRVKNLHTSYHNDAHSYTAIRFDRFFLYFTYTGYHVCGVSIYAFRGGKHALSDTRTDYTTRIHYIPRRGKNLQNTQLYC